LIPSVRRHVGSRSEISRSRRVSSQITGETRPQELLARFVDGDFGIDLLSVGATLGKRLGAALQARVDLLDLGARVFRGAPIPTSAAAILTADSATGIRTAGNGRVVTSPEARFANRTHFF
jgi:hypothetical protein